MSSVVVTTYHPEQTAELGRFVGARLRPGALLPLRGELGAGKTCFARGLVEGLAIDDLMNFSSPSFTLMNCYNGRLPIYHFDFYRLSSPDEVFDIGFMDFLDGHGVVIVEWPEIVLDEFPAGALAVKIAFMPGVEFEARRITFEDSHNRYPELMKELADVSFRN